MNIADAAHKTVLDYPGGSVALATRLISINDRGEEKPMSAAVLRSKVNPNTRTHHLTLAEASEIMGLSGDFRILHALAAEHDFIVQRADVTLAGGVVESLLDAGELKGKLCKLIADSYADQVLTLNEAKALATLCGQLQAIFGQMAQAAFAEAKVTRAAA
ncbi:phage regulatory CII family protein [Xanthomonas sp. WHRI 6106]|uniref:phage regulatory CII family protein n=1 Tax=Xanthomonas sp. WHRI 6106 TaxID=3161566 RepID=UPI0032E8DB93